MKKAVCIRSLFLTLLVLFVVGSSQAQKITLKLALDAGKTYYQNMTSKSSVAQEVAGKAVNVEVELNGKISYEVLDFTDKIYNLKVKYDMLRMTMDAPGKGKMTLSSEMNDDTNPASKLLAAIVGNSFNVKITALGEVKEVIGMDSMLARIFAATPELSQPKMEMFKQQIDKAYGVESFKKNFGMSLGIFPQKEVSIGESWEDETAVSDIVSMQIKTKFTLEKADDAFYYIKSESTLVSKNAALEAGGISMNYDLSGTMTAAYLINKKSGWSKETKVEQEISGKITFAKNDKLPDGMTIPMTVKSSMMFTE